MHRLLMIVIVKGFPEADPNIEQTEAAAQAAKKTGGDHDTKPGIGKQKRVVGPLRGPWQNQKQDSGDGADQHEKKNRAAMQPELHSCGSSGRDGDLRVEESRNVFARCGRGTAFDGKLGIGAQWALRSGSGGASENQGPSPRSGQACWR